MKTIRTQKLVAALGLALGVLFATSAHAADKKPNILIIWGDDIGYWNISAYNQGMMGYKTPNIDRIAKEGAMFTDWYGQQSCTAGRAAFITGQVGVPHRHAQGRPAGRARKGCRRATSRIAELLKAQGYMTGAVRQEPSRRPRRASADGPRLRRVLRLALPPQRRGRAGESRLLQGSGDAEEVRDARRDPHLGEPGRHAEDREHRPAHQEAHGNDRRGGHQGRARLSSWTTRRRRTSRSSCGGTPPACTSSRTSRRRARARPASASIPTAWSSTTAMVGQVLDKLKELGLDENTIVMYSTDNGAEKFTWPDGGTSPFRGEKNTNWEGGYRVPATIRWPGVIKPGTVFNDIFAHEDMLPTLLAAAGVPDVKEQLLKGMQGRRQDLQGASRRLQHHRRARRQGAEPAQGVLLLQRRRLAGGAALRPVEDRLRRAARAQASTSGRSRS